MTDKKFRVAISSTVRSLEKGIQEIKGYLSLSKLEEDFKAMKDDIKVMKEDIKSILETVTGKTSSIRAIENLNMDHNKCLPMPLI